MSHHDFRQRDGFSNGEAPLSCTNQLSHSTAARLIAVINHHDRFEVFLQRLSIDRHLHSPSIWSSSIHHANKDNRLDTLVHTKVTTLPFTNSKKTSNLSWCLDPCDESCSWVLIVDYRVKVVLHHCWNHRAIWNHDVTYRLCVCVCLLAVAVRVT